MSVARGVGLEIAEFESTLKVKRDISPADLKNLARLDNHLPQCPWYVAGMVKAMLCSPSTAVDSDGRSTLFQPSDYSSLSASKR